MIKQKEPEYVTEAVLYGVLVPCLTIEDAKALMPVFSGGHRGQKAILVRIDVKEGRTAITKLG